MENYNPQLTNIQVSKTDEEIARKVQAGDGMAFSILMSRYESKIHRYTRKFLSNPQDAQDIVQEIFIKAYRNMQSFDSSRKFSAWVYRIAHNECINFLKKKKIEFLPLIDFDMLFPHFAKDEKAGDAQTFEIKDMVSGSLSMLDAKYREPLLLYYSEGFGYKEIGEILRIPVATVGVRLSRAKTLLQQFYKSIEAEEKKDGQNLKRSEKSYVTMYIENEKKNKNRKFSANNQLKNVRG